VHPFSVGAQGEVVILVPTDEAEAARAILSKK
jgi:hydrogenase maturation factor